MSDLEKAFAEARRRSLAQGISPKKAPVAEKKKAKPAAERKPAADKEASIEKPAAKPVAAAVAPNAAAPKAAASKPSAPKVRTCQREEIGTDPCRLP